MFDFQSSLGFFFNQVFSFFYRSALTVGLLVFAGWPVITQLWLQAKVLHCFGELLDYMLGMPRNAALDSYSAMLLSLFISCM